MEAPESTLPPVELAAELNPDPSANWVLQPDLPLHFDLETFSLCGVRLGDPADSLSFLGPAEDRALAREGRLFYYSIGLEVLVEEGKVALYRIIWRDEAAEGFNPYPGRCVKHEPPVEVETDTSELGIRRAFGGPFFKETDNQGVVVFYEAGEYGWDVEFNLKGSIKQFTVYSPPLTEEEKKALQPRSEEEEEEDEAPEPDRTVLQEIGQLLLWPFLPYLLVVLTVIFGSTFQGLRRIHQFVKHGVPAQATIVRQEETPLQSGKVAKTFIYLYRDQKGQVHTSRVSAEAAQRLGRQVGDHFELTYDRRDPGDHVRSRVSAASLRTGLKNAALFVTIAVVPVFLLTVGAGFYLVYQRRHPRPAPAKVDRPLPSVVPFAAPTPQPKRRRDTFWLIVQVFAGLCTLVALQLFWIGVNESRAYQRMWERGAPGEAAIVRMVRVPSAPGVEEYEVVYQYTDRNGEDHVCATRARKQEDRYYIAYYQMTNPIFGKKWPEWVRAPELGVGKKLIVSYYQDDPATHLPFLMSEDLMGRPIMSAVRVGFSLLSTLVCFFTCFFGIGYLVTLKR